MLLRLGKGWLVCSSERVWLEDDESQRKALLADTVEGVPTSSILSERFRSAAYLPGADPPVATDDFASWLDSDRIRPRLRKLTGSSHGKIPRRHVRRHGLRFRFRADEKVDFECRFDDRRWSPCTSPQRRFRATVGHHLFRVRARDLAGNPATRVLRWRLRVTRGR